MCLHLDEGRTLGLLASLLAIIVVVIIRSFDKNEGYILSAEDIARMENRIALASIVAEQPKRPALVQVEAH